MEISGEKLDGIGEQMYVLIKRLFPICRSITGDGVRETLKIISEIIPVQIHEVPSGTKVFDWTVPKEWNIKDAYIKNSKGEKIVDFKKSNLHVLNYSIPINKKMNFSELKEHLFTLPKYPDWIPYLTSYYKENWGFCIPHKLYEKLEDDTYEVFIDSTLKDGHLTYGELYIKGELEDEFLLSTYICHPSLCNDNLSGPALLTYLAKTLLNKKLRYSYRFLFIPETIGAITWLCLNEEKIKKIKHGFVVTCVGDSNNMTYKLSRQEDAEIDKAVKKVLEDSKEEFKIIDFFPPGSDERQYGSLAFKLAIGSLMRSTYDTYAQYHTSADNLDFIGARYLADSYDKYLKVINVIESNKVYKNLYPKCEPQLGRRGVYRMIGGLKNEEDAVWAIIWLLNLCDGTNSLLDISIKSKIDFSTIKGAADALEKVEILKEVR